MKNNKMIIVKNGKKYFFRFTANQRVQHFILFSTVITLVLTGMPLKFHQSAWAVKLYSLLGGIHLAPIIHRVAGTILLILFAYHVSYLVFTVLKDHIYPLKKSRQLTLQNIAKAILNLPMMPKLRDVTDLLALLKYLLFLTDKRPELPEFTWKEKVDYWAPFWGIVVIGVSGLIMWANELSSHILPGKVLNFALIAHSDEALLAALFLFIWHFYNVHFSTSVFPIGTAFLTGYKSEDLMVEEHYEYYVEVMKKAGLEHEIKPPHHASRRAEEDRYQDDRDKKVEYYIELLKEAGLEDKMIPPQDRKSDDFEAEEQARYLARRHG